MRTRAAVTFLFCLALGLVAAPAQAQYGVFGVRDPATGETYNVEIGGYLWSPTPRIAITSEELGIIGSRIDFVEDLGIEKTMFKQLKVVLRPGLKHKIRFEYTPIRYEATGTLERDIVFNGIRFPIALPVDTELIWKAYRFGYEADIVYRDRGFFGLIFDVKYTDVEATLENAFDTQFVRARAPIPAIGAIGRVYAAPNISITGEFSAFKLPDIDEEYRARYIDFDIYGTVNFSDNFGAQLGYRSLDVFYQVDTDEGDMVLRGWYFGGVLRF